VDEVQFKDISVKVDTIWKLLALNSVGGLEPDRQIEFLSSIGLKPSEISPIVGRTPNAVSIVLYDLKKGKKKRASRTSLTSKRQTSKDPP